MKQLIILIKKLKNKKIEKRLEENLNDFYIILKTNLNDVNDNYIKKYSIIKI